jgi:hypothetical protein
MSAMWPWTIWSSASGAPKRWRSAPDERERSSARRAKPRAAAPTVVRKTSSTAIATLKPSPGSPISAEAGRRQPLEAQAGERVRRDGLDPLGDRSPGVSAGTTNAERPRAPGASPVRAKTV